MALGTALVGALRASLSLDTAAFEDGSKKAISHADKLARNINRSLKTIGVGAAVQQIISAFKSVIDHADRMQEVSQRLGVPIRELEGLSLIAKTTGTSFETLTGGVGRLAKAMQQALARPTSEAARAFQALGISLDEISRASPSEALVMLANRFQNTADGSRKLAASLTLLGRSAGSELIPLLNQGGTEIQRFIGLAEQLGITVDQKTAVAADRFNDNIIILQASLQGIVTQLVSHMLPTLDRLVQKWADTAQGASPAQRAVIVLKDAFNSLVMSIASLETRLENLKTTWIALQQIWKMPITLNFFDDVAAVWDTRTKEIEANFHRLDAAWGQLNNSINSRGGIAGGGGIGGSIGGTAGGAEEPPIISVPKKAKPFWDGLSQSVKLTADELGELPPLSKELASTFDNLGGDIGMIFLDAAQGTQSLKDSFRELVDDMLRQVIRLLANRAFQQFLGMMLGPSAMPVGVGPGGMGFTHFGGPRAAGGRVHRGKFNLVGERGPELFAPRTAGSIVPNHALGPKMEIKIIDQRTTASPRVEGQQGGDGSMEFVIRDQVRKQFPSALNRQMPAQFGMRPRLQQRGS